MHSIQGEFQQTKDTLNQNMKEMNEELEKLKVETIAQKLLLLEQQQSHAAEMDKIQLEHKNLQQKHSDL